MVQVRMWLWDWKAMQGNGNAETCRKRCAPVWSSITVGQGKPVELAERCL